MEPDELERRFEFVLDVLDHYKDRIDKLEEAATAKAEQTTEHRRHWLGTVLEVAVLLLVAVETVLTAIDVASKYAR